MARRGGYGRDVEGIEWAKLSAHQDAEAKLSAASMGQSYYTWLNDAVAFHVYYCERYQLHQLYQHDMTEADRTRGITPQPYEPKYQTARERPTLTLATRSHSGTANRRSPRP